MSTPFLLSRRALLGQSLAGVGALTTGSVLRFPLATSSQIDVATPSAPPTVEPMPFGSTIASKAAELDYDLGRIFRFVTDEVLYEPYTGALRGANGTLWSLAGNSIDKALLLGALLDEAQIEHRYVMGSLDDDGQQAITASSPSNADIVRERSTAAQVVALSLTLTEESTPQAEPALTSEQQRELDDLIAQAASTLDRANDLTTSTLTTITTALDEAGITLPIDLPAPVEDTSRYLWIQVSDGPNQIDLDPTLPNAEMGTVSANGAPQVVTVLPDDLIHTVALSVAIEEYRGGTSVRRQVMTGNWASADLVNVPILINALPPADLSSIGYTLNVALGGNIAVVPTLLAGTASAYADVPLVFANSVNDPLSNGDSGAGLIEGEALALWLTVTVTSPGREPIVTERALYDRIGDEARASRSIDFNAIPPVTFVTDSAGQTYVRGLTSVYQVAVDSAWLPFPMPLGSRIACSNSGNCPCSPRP